MYYLGGMTPIGCGWVNPQACYVDFESEFESGWLWQLYANRQLIGQTRSPGERRVVGQLVASALPAPLTLLRVDPDNILTDYGAYIPDSAWNTFEANWSVSGMPDDTDHFDVLIGASPEAAVDPEVVTARVPYTGDGDYSFLLPPFEENGEWEVAIVARDDAYPLGNDGDTESATITVACPPPDVYIQSDGQRMAVSIADGVLTVTFDYEAPE